ncbi:MAG: hypothetical protein AAGI71_06340 [Bacteroidota bacterium]
MKNRMRALGLGLVLTVSAVLAGCSAMEPPELVPVQVELVGFGGNFVWVVLEGDLVFHAKLDTVVAVQNGPEVTTITYTERGLRWLDVQWDQTQAAVRPRQYRTQMSLDNEDQYFVRIDVSDPEEPELTVQTAPF